MAANVISLKHIASINGAAARKWQMLPQEMN